ncbi:unnamed protein product [Heterobilharzia americana]|nr:unnamed protein product [Heterobilharzia americana]
MPVWLRTLMNHCWNDEPENRPSFMHISNEIKIPNINSFTPNMHRSIDNQQNKIVDNTTDNHMNTSTACRLTVSIKDKRIREN